MQGLGFRVRVLGLEFMVQALGFRVLKWSLLRGVGV